MYATKCFLANLIRLQSFTILHYCFKSFLYLKTKFMSIFILI